MKKAERDLFPKILVLLVILLLVYSIYDHRQSVYQDLDFREVLAEYEQQVSFGRDNEAVETLRPLLHIDLSSFQYLQILKRTGKLAENGTGVSLHADFAHTAADRFPGREEFWFIYCRALILKGNPERAGEIALEKLKSERFLGMRAESLIAAGMELDDITKEMAAESAFKSGGLIILLDSRDPQKFSAAGREWNSSELIADAALLYAEAGSVPEGNELLKNSPENPFPELSLQMAYDANDPQFGLVLVQEMLSGQSEAVPGLKLYEADFSLLLGRGEKALEIYRDIIRMDPKFSVLPYINAAVLDSDTAERYLVQGLEYFPRSVILLERLGELYYTDGNTASAREIFNQILEIIPGHPGAQIRLADMELGAGSQGSVARLWDAYHGEKGEALALYLGWRLFGNRDQEGLRVLIDLQQQRKGPDQNLLEGLYLSLKGDFQRAAENFEVAYQKDPRWEYLFNAGRLYLEGGEAQKALETFSAADEIFTRRGDLPAEKRSRIWLGIGESYLALGDKKNSANALNYALDLDASNLRASLLMNTLGQMN